MKLRIAAVEFEKRILEGMHREVALGPKEPVLELVSGNIKVIKE